jgi:hypothetical protein
MQVSFEFPGFDVKDIDEDLNALEDVISLRGHVILHKDILILEFRVTIKKSL